MRVPCQTHGCDLAYPENTEFDEKVLIGALDYLVLIYPQKAGYLANFHEPRLIEFFGHHMPSIERKTKKNTEFSYL
jgi:hypothetical protein